MTAPWPPPPCAYNQNGKASPVVPGSPQTPLTPPAGLLNAFAGAALQTGTRIGSTVPPDQDDAVARAKESFRRSGSLIINRDAWQENNAEEEKFGKTSSGHSSASGDSSVDNFQNAVTKRLSCSWNGGGGGDSTMFSITGSADSENHHQSTENQQALLIRQLSRQVWTDPLPTELLRDGGWLTRVCCAFFKDLETHFRIDFFIKSLDPQNAGIATAFLVAAAIIAIVNGVNRWGPVHYLVYVLCFLLTVGWWSLYFLQLRLGRKHEHADLHVRLMNFIACTFFAIMGCWLCLSNRQLEKLGLLNDVDESLEAGEELNLLRLSISMFAFSTIFQPDLFFLLVFVNMSPVAYIILGFSLVDDLSSEALQVVERAIYLFFAGIICFIAARGKAIEMRKRYVDSRLNKTRDQWKATEIKSLKKELNRTRRPSIIEMLMNREHQKRLETLRSKIENVVMRRQIQSLHENLVREYANVSCNMVHDPLKSIEYLTDGLDVLRKKSEAESNRLGELMAETYDVWASLPDWRTVENVPSFDKRRAQDKEKPHQLNLCSWWGEDGRTCTWDPSNTWIPELQNGCGLVEDRIRWFTQRAAWARCNFETIFSNVVKAFNDAEEANDLGLDPQNILRKWNHEHPNHPLYEFPFPKDASLCQEGFSMAERVKVGGDYLVHGRHAALQIGPVKDVARAGAKVEEFLKRDDLEQYPDLKRCPEKYICDWLRGRVIFAHPLQLTLFFWYLKSENTNENFEVIACKNKLKERPETDTSVSFQLLVSMGSRGESHVAELQLLLDNFLVAKDLEHKYYEFRRAEKLSEILMPVFPPEPKKSKKRKSRPSAKDYASNVTNVSNADGGSNADGVSSEEGSGIEKYMSCESMPSLPSLNVQPCGSGVGESRQGSRRGSVDTLELLNLHRRGSVNESRRGSVCESRRGSVTESMLGFIQEGAKESKDSMSSLSV